MPLALAPFIPQELFDHIIDHLHNEYATLLNCSLVCQAWIPSSRLHLFSQIFLTIPKFQEGTFIGPALAGACTRLYDLLSKSPEIVPHIHELSITCSEPAALTPIAAVEVESPVYGLIVEEKLPPLLSMLSSLKRFAFVSGGNMSWANIPERLRRAINDVFSLSSLTYVRLCSWIFPDPSSFTALLGQSPNLKGLALWGITFGPDSLVPLFSVLSLNDGESIVHKADNNDNDMPITTTKLGPNLEFLTLDYIDFTPLGDWLLTQPSLLGLIGLRELRVAHSNIKSIERLLRGLGDSLQHFHLKPGPLGLQPIELVQNAGLRSIRFTLEHNTLALSWVTNVLSTLSAPKLLENFAIEIFIDPKKLTGWDKLAGALEQMPSLRKVDVGIFAHPTHAEFSKVEQALTSLATRGILRVYQLGTKSQKSSVWPPLISSYEDTS